MNRMRGRRRRSSLSSKRERNVTVAEIDGKPYFRMMVHTDGEGMPEMSCQYRIRLVRFAAASVPRFQWNPTMPLSSLNSGMPAWFTVWFGCLAWVLSA